MNFRVTNCNDHVCFNGTLRDCLAVALKQCREYTGFHHIDTKHDGRLTTEDVTKDEKGVEWRYLAFMSSTNVDIYETSLQAMKIVEKFANERNITVTKVSEL
jgi:hypothetical protein